MSSWFCLQIQEHVWKHIFLSDPSHGMCASSAGPFLGEAPSLVSKAQVSGPEAGRPKATSSWAIVPPGWNSSWTRRSQGCLAEELLLPQRPSPALYIPSLQAGIGMPSLLDCSVEVGWNDAPQSWGWTPVPSTLSQMSCSQFTWVKKTKHKDGPPSRFLFPCEASSRAAPRPLLIKGYQTVHQALASTHPLDHF